MRVDDVDRSARHTHPEEAKNESGNRNPAKNIQNRAVIAATAAAGIPGPATSYLDEPRTYGVRFTANY